MKIARKKTSRKKVALVALALVLALGIMAGSLYALKLWPFSQPSNTEVNKIDLSEPSEEAKEAAEAVKKQTTNTTDKFGNNSGRAVAPEVPAGTKADSGLRITRAVQSGEQVSIRTLIPVFTGQGTCELSMDGPEGASYKASAPVQAMASSSTCAGFNIPVGELTGGTWKVTIVLSNENLSGSDSTEVVVK